MKRIQFIVVMAALIVFILEGCASIDSIRTYENSPLVNKYEQLKSENSLNDRDKVRKGSGCALCRW